MGGFNYRTARPSGEVVEWSVVEDEHCRFYVEVDGKRIVEDTYDPYDAARHADAILREGAVRYEIPLENMPTFEDRFAKLTKRAARLAKRGKLADESPIGYQVVGTVRKPQPDTYKWEGGKRIVFKHPDLVCNVVEVTGAAPKIAGWTFIATLQHEGEAGTILRTVPNVTVPQGALDRFRSADPRCEHCGKLRNRRDTYVVLSDAGETKQVGSNCLQDFFAGKSPEGVAALAELLCAADELAGSACDEGGFGGGARREVMPLDQYLPYVACSIRLGGWMSRTAAREREDACMATADHAWMYGAFPAKDCPESKRLKPEPQDVEQAEQALAYAQENLGDSSDYEHNLRVVMLSSIVTDRTAGLAASMVSWYLREVGKALEHKRLAATSEYVGTVGQRQEFGVCTLERVFDVDTMYGTLHIHRFADVCGNVIVWKTNSKNLTPGEKYSVKGTVKDHSEYKGVKQTNLSRAAVKLVVAESVEVK